MTPIKPFQAQSVHNGDPVRWLGADGGYRTGRIVADEDKAIHALDPLRGEVVYLEIGQYEFNVPKDNDGKPV